MNTLSTIFANVFGATLAAADAAKPNDKAPPQPFFGSDGIIGPWQMVLIGLLIALLVFWWIYRKKQADNQ